MKRFSYLKNRNSLSKAFTIWLILLICASVNSAQTAANNDAYRKLNAGEIVEGKIKKDEINAFILTLKRGELVHITVENRGIEIVLAIGKNDENRKIIKQVDEIKSLDGAENLVFMAESDGEYLFGVFGFGATEGNYVLRNSSPFKTDDEKKKAATELEKSGGETASKNDFETAILYRENALKLRGESSEAKDLAGLFFDLGSDYFTLKRFERSAEYYEKAAAAYRSVKEFTNEAISFSNVGAAFSNLKNYEKATAFYEKSRQIYHEIKDKTGEAGILNNIGFNFLIENKTRNALENFEKSLAIYRELKNETEEAKTLITLGQTLNNVEEFSGALKYFKQALTLSRRLKNRSQESDALLGIGAAFMEIGEYEQALANSIEVEKIAVELKNRETEAQAAMKIGLIYTEIGQYDKPFAYYEKVRKIALELKNLNLEASALINTGVVYFRIGSYAESKNYYEKALKIGEETNDKIIIAVGISGLGANATRLREHDKAVALFEKAVPMQRELNMMSGVVINNYYHGIIMRERGNYARAVALHRESVELAHRHKVRKYEARSLYELGADYLAQNDLEAATVNFEQALRVARAVKVRDNEARALDGLMTVWARRGANSAAIFYGKQAVNLHQTIRQDIKFFAKENQTDYLKDNERTYRTLADLLISEGRLPEAQQILAMLKEEELSGFVKRDAKEIENLAKRADLRPNEKIALERYALISAKVTEIGAELSKLEDAKRQIKTGETFAEQARFDELTAQLKDANTAFRVFLEKELAAELGKEKKKEIEQDRALQGKLKNWGAGTVALSTILGADRYRVILTTPNAQIDGKTEIKAAELNGKIFAFREALLNPAIDPKPLGKELYDVLIKPIEKDLEAAGAKTLLWSLDGTLRYIPIAALWDGNQYLVQKYQNVIVTSTTRQSLQAEVNKNWQILGAGVTKASEVTDENTAQKYAFDELKSVAKELTAIVGDAKNDSKGVSLLDAAFTENALKQQLTETADDKRKYNVVHFATHFRLGSDTADSFLLIGNNQALTLAEVADSPEMNLNDVELVTLSACNTGFGGVENKQTLTENNGKEVDSLAQFIELRGAKSVMATLWSVADESTAILMGEFYKLRKENAAWTKAETLRQAQLELLYGKYSPAQATEKNRSEAVRFGASAKTMPKFTKDEKAPFAHPFYWSPFVLIGNWR